MSTKRRRLLGALAGLALCPPGRAASDGAPADPAMPLRAGGRGLVVAMRHALAPGTFDPPGFRRGDCSTQRNLSDAGREQARRIGAWFRTHRLEPQRVRSSSWCRCLETARLAGVAPAGFEVWVTHQANIAALADAATASGEALLLRHDRRRDAVVVVAALRIA